MPTASETPAGKAALRLALLAARRAIDPHTRAQWDARLCARVLAWYGGQLQELARMPLAGALAPSLGVYWPLRGEPDLAAAYAALAVAGATLALPVVVARDAPLAFAAWTPGEAMTVDAMGVAVPAMLRLVDAPALLLVPCLGFNAQGYRLGYGGGYYDRTLAAAPRPRTAGVAYACMQAPFGAAAHDVALDAVLTEAD